MKRHEIFWVLAVLVAVTSLFFYKVLFVGHVPLPADALVSDFQPWRSTSYLGYGAGGIPNKAQYPDTIRQIYPWKTLVVESLKSGKLPLWNPYNFSGAPLLANFQSAALYPLNIFYFVLTQIDAWTLLVILQPLLASLITYLYCRKVGMGALGSWLAAVSYGFSGFMAVWLEYNTVGHVILWLPMMFLAIEHNKERPQALWLGSLTLAHAAALLAGHPQVYMYTLVFSIFYAFRRIERKMWGYIGGFSLLGIGVAGLQLIPGIELITHAARSPHDPTNLFTRILIQPWQLLSLPFPNLFGNPATRTYWPPDTFVGKVTTIGLVPLFFALSALRRKDSITKWFIVASGIILVLITNNPITQLLYRIQIPLLTSSSPTLMSFLLAFSLAVSCGFGLEYWMTDKHSIKKLLRRSLEIAVVLGMLAFATKLPAIPHFFEHAPIVLRALTYASIVSAGTLTLFWIAIQMPKFRTQAIILLLIVHTFDLFVFFNRFNPFSPKALVFPNHHVLDYLKSQAPNRYWGYGTAGIAANFASQYGVFSPEGYDPLYPRWYGEFLYSYRNGKPMTTFDNATRSDAAIASRFGDGGLSDTNKQMVLNELSVRYILDRSENNSTEQIFPPNVFKRVYAFEDWTVYENTHARPRAFIEGGIATITSYRPEQVTILTDSQQAGDLVVTDTYYPGWVAAVDGVKTPVRRSETSMRAIPIAAGAHTVTMSFDPVSVRYGTILSMISIGVTIIGLIYVGRKKS